MGNNTVIIISGQQGSGKSTLVKEVHTLLFKTGLFMPMPINFADPLYKMHELCLNVMGEYGVDVPQKDGKLLQVLGTEWGRATYGHDVWVEMTKRRVDRLSNMGITPKPMVWIIGDCRFKNEADAFPGAIKVRLKCPEEVRKQRIDKTPGQMWRTNTAHASEMDLNDYTDWTMVIDTEVTPPDLAAQMVVSAINVHEKA